MTDNERRQHLGEEAHIEGLSGCAIGYLVSHDIIIARRVFALQAQGFGTAWLGVWRISKNIGFHMGSECPNR